MRAAPLFVLCLLLAGCSGGGSQRDADADGQAMASAPDGAEGMAAATPTKPVKMQAVQDSVSFSGTLGAGACWFDGNEVSCANVGGHNVLVYAHDRKGSLMAGQLTVSFTPDAGAGPYATAFIADGCPDACRAVSVLADGRPELMPSGPTGSFELEIPAVTILDNQTFVVRVAPLMLSSLASATPSYDIDLTGTLDFEVPA